MPSMGYLLTIEAWETVLREFGKNTIDIMMTMRFIHHASSERIRSKNSSVIHRNKRLKNNFPKFGISTLHCFILLSKTALCLFPISIYFEFS